MTNQITMLFTLMPLSLYMGKIKFVFKTMSEDTEEIPQSRSITLPKHQKKERKGINKDKINAIYSTTGALCVRLFLFLFIYLLFVCLFVCLFVFFLCVTVIEY